MHRIESAHLLICMVCSLQGLRGAPGDAGTLGSIGDPGPRVSCTKQLNSVS